MYAMCCCPCAIGTTLSNTIGKMNYKSYPPTSIMIFIYTFPLFLGMPFLMGCCCVSLCGARNIVRYQYRIGGDECFDDYCTPVMVCSVSYCALACTSLCVPFFCCWPCIPCCLGAIFGVYSYFVAVVMKILQESEVQLKARGGVPGFYLSSPPSSALNDNRAMLPSTNVYVNNNHLTFPSNAHYAQVVPTNELGNHSGGGGPGFYLPSSPASALNDNRAMLPSTNVYVNNNHVTFPSNVHYAQVVPTNELGNHSGGGGPGQYSYVPIAVAAEESPNTYNKNYE